MKSNKEKLAKVLYGNIYPHFWCNGVFMEKLLCVLDELGISHRTISSPDLIYMLLTEEEAERILKSLSSLNLD